MTMTTRDLAKHIYNFVIESENKMEKESFIPNNNDVINYISYLMELHFEPESHLGSMGFMSTSNVDRNEFGC
jgi:hypothetical protein